LREALPCVIAATVILFLVSMALLFCLGDRCVSLLALVFGRGLLDLRQHSIRIVCNARTHSCSNR
jgi:hypothetical protein